MAITITGKITQTGKSAAVFTPVLPTPGDIGVFIGGEDWVAGPLNSIEYIIISSLGNAVDFGDIVAFARGGGTGTSNGTNDRGIAAGGQPSTVTARMDYITISSPSNSTVFGNLSVSRKQLGSTSNGTGERGVFAGGSPATNVMDYVTISSTGSAGAFGVITGVTSSRWPRGTSNGTDNRGVFYGGDTNNDDNIIFYITITSLGDSIDFGDMPDVSSGYSAATSNGTNGRAIFGNGNTPTNVISYLTISSLGNAADFGDLTVARYGAAAVSNATDEMGVFGGGSDGAGVLNLIDYVTIDSLGNATDFGDFLATNGVHVQSGTSDGLT